MNKRTLILSAALAAIAIVGAVKLLVPNRQSQPPELVTLRYLGTPGSLGFYRLATELGFAADEGIEFEYVGVYSGGPAEIQALAAGSIDVSNAVNTIAVAQARKAGFKVKLIAALNSTQVYDESGQPASFGGLVVHEDSDINGPADMVGKRIGVNTRGAAAEYAIRKWLRSANITPDSVELIVIPSANMVQVFQQRQIDALYAWSTTVQRIKDSERVRVFPELEIVGADVIVGGLVVSDDLIANKPDVVRRFMRAYVRAWDWARENPSEYRQIYERVARDEGGTPDMARYLPIYGRPHALLTTQDVEFWLNELVLAGKFREGEVDPRDLYTNEFNPY